MRDGGTNSITLVLGGVRSGKSRFAQTLAEQYPRVTFLATAPRRADDPEMQAKIARHIADRPAHWSTLEVSLEANPEANPEAHLDLPAALARAAPQSDAILIDCLTLYAAGLLEQTNPEAAIASLCAALTATPCPVLLVSNEVGSGVVPAYASGRRFRDLVGELNQRVAALAGTVLLMVAGLPLALKGSVPPPGGAPR